MAKNMAKIENGAAINILWCSDREKATETLIDLADRPVGIGDTYTDGKFYRDGVEVLTPLESAQAQNAQLQAENTELTDTIATMVDEVYNSDMEMMGI